MPPISNGATSSEGHARFSHIVRASDESAYLSAAPDLVAVILDVDPYAWAAAATSSSDSSSSSELLRRIVIELCIFLNAHTAIRHENAVAVYAAAHNRAELLFSNAPLSSSSSNNNGNNNRQQTKSAREVAERGGSKPDANTYQPFKLVDDAVLDGVAAFLEACKPNADNTDAQNGTTNSNGGKKEQRHSTGIVSALAQALCHIHRLSLSSAAGADASAGSAGMGSVSIHGGSTSAAGRSGGAAAARGGYKSRILVLSASPDSSSQYVPVMNCIFGAQKRGVLVDVCKLFGTDSVFLQQASHLTGGTYFRIKNINLLLQTLMAAFLASPTLRNQIRLPSNDDVDFRAACFCHGNIVDVGYVCSVCLSIFCTPRERCITCRAVFPQRTLDRYEAEKETYVATSAAETTAVSS